MATRIRKMLYKALCEREEGKEYTRTLREISFLVMQVDEQCKEQYGFLVFFYRLKLLPLLSYKDFRTLIFDLMGMIERGEVDGIK